MRRRGDAFALSRHRRGDGSRRRAYTFQPHPAGLLWLGPRLFWISNTGTRRELAVILPDPDKQFVYVARLTNGTMCEPGTWAACAAWAMERVRPKAAAA